jgi:hypothetical protein
LIKKTIDNQSITPLYPFAGGGSGLCRSEISPHNG